MKKILFFLFLFPLVLSGCCFSKEKEELKSSWEKISYFREENLIRYEKYYQKHPTLSLEQVVTYVNLNLDCPFYTNTKETSLSSPITVLVNKFFFLPSTYIPENLETIDSNYSSGNRQLVREARQSFEQMAIKAKEDGLSIRAISAYRSYNYQQILYQKYVNQDGIEKADTYSARPGHSEHQAGLVVDIDNFVTDFNAFENTKEFEWMQNNAHKYGFILRYPKGKESITGYNYESWHYRYVGIEIATDMKNLDLTFDEYYIRFLENAH